MSVVIPIWAHASDSRHQYQAVIVINETLSISRDYSNFINVYDACLYCELKTEKGTAHIPCMSMASIQCEHGCGP